MPLLTKMIAETGDEGLYILADYVGYGHYSAPEAFSQYFDALKAVRAKGHRVQLDVYDDDTISVAYPKQEPRPWNAISSDPKFQLFYSKHPELPKPKSRNEHFDILLKRQKHYQDELMKESVTVNPKIRGLLPIFMWLRPRREAIFSMYVLPSSGAASEISLHTKDAVILELLEKIRTDADNGQINTVSALQQLGQKLEITLEKSAPEQKQ